MKLREVAICLWITGLTMLAFQPPAQAATVTIGDTSVSLTTYNTIFKEYIIQGEDFVHVHSQWVAQEFTAPVTGSFHQVTLAIHKHGNPWYYSDWDGTKSDATITIMITGLTANGPDFDPIAPPVVYAVDDCPPNLITANEGTWTTFGVAYEQNPIQVTQGTKYAIFVVSQSNIHDGGDKAYHWETDASNSYNGGTTWYINYWGVNKPAAWSSANYDMPFSITFTY